MSTSHSKSFREWEKISAPENVLSWIKDGARLQFTTEVPTFEEHNYQVFTHKEIHFVSQEIKKLILSGYIKKVNYKPYCVSPIVVVPKKGMG